LALDALIDHIQGLRWNEESGDVRDVPA